MEDNQPKIKSKQERFEQTIKPILYYVGLIGAILTSLAYIAIVLIMVFGTTVSTSTTQSIIFAIINAAIGLIIMQFLKIQGIDFARTIPNNETILKEFNQMRAKKKKAHSIKFFWITSIAKDIIIKGITIAATTLGVIYIVIQATNNYTLLLLAIVNLLLFVCFGLMALVKAYDFFNDEHIPFIKEKINEHIKEEQEQLALAELQRQNEILEEEKRREQNIEAEIARRVEMAKKELIKQRNRDILSGGGSDILDSSMGTCAVSDNSGPVLLEHSNTCDCVLGGTDNTSNTPSIGADFWSQETLSNNKEETK